MVGSLIVKTVQRTIDRGRRGIVTLGIRLEFFLRWVVPTFHLYIEFCRLRGKSSQDTHHVSGKQAGEADRGRKPRATSSDH